MNERQSRSPLMEHGARPMEQAGKAAAGVGGAIKEAASNVADKAQDVAGKLNGTAKRIQIVELPDLPLKGDVSDWINAGGTKQQLVRLVEHATDWHPAAKSKDKPVKEAPPTEDELATEFVRLHGENFRYVSDFGHWYEWDGSRFRREKRGMGWAR